MKLGEFVPFQIAYLYDGSNAQEIVDNANGHFFIDEGKLAYYLAGVVYVPENAVVTNIGGLYASVEEFNKFFMSFSSH